MMASGTMKELSKAIGASIPNETLPLPDDVVEIIQAYLDKHTPAEESDSQRLQDELLGMYQKEVKDSPSRYPVFIAILRQLRPAISTSSRILQWWETLVVPVLDHLTEEKGLAAQTRGILLDILAYDTDDGEDSEDAVTSAILSEKLLEMWLKKSSIESTEVEPKHKFLEEQIQLVLMDFGRKRPKGLLRTIDKFFVKREYRAQVLSLLCEFIRHSPPHLHQVMETTLFVNLLRCLQIDTSTTVVSVAMTALVMFLPHIPNSMSKHLPALFNIYTRILFWERERVLSPELQSDHDPEKSEDEEGKKSDAPKWEKLTYSFDSDDDTVPELLHYFTFLYGLYPINFMSYIRKPGRYLRHANFPGADDIDVQPSEIRERSEPFRHVHLLHQNFYTMTIESELTDPNRWMRSEASDVVAACMSLCGPTYPGLNALPGPPPTSRLPELPTISNGDVPEQILEPFDENLQSGRQSSETDDARDPSWRNTTSTVVASPVVGDSLSREITQTSQPRADSPNDDAQHDRTDSPTLPPQLIFSSSNEDVNDNQIFRGSLDQSLPNPSEVSFVSSHQNKDGSAMDSYLQSLPHHAPRAPSMSLSIREGSGTLASLHREIMLLKNDLNFERYLKQQHLSHIGQLRRKHVREATVEAETQNLINSNKGLKNKLEDAKVTTLQMKKESDKSRHHSKKWETELTSKLRALKDEQKKWHVESEELRRDLAAAKENNYQLRQLVVASEAKALASRQKVQSIELNVNELEKLRQEVTKLTKDLRTYEAGEMDTERARASEALALTKVDIVEMKLKAREAELERARLSANREIDNLNGRLEQANLDLQNKQPVDFQSMIDSALAVTRSRLTEAQKAHAHLLKRFTNLQASYLALQDQRFSDEPLLSGGEDYPHYSPIVPQRSRNRPRGMSNPDAYDTSSPGTSSPPNIPRPQRAETSISQRGSLPRPSSQADGRISQRFNTADFISHGRSGSDGTAGSVEMDHNGVPKIKPQSEVRVYGRGGVQNIGKKEKDKAAKKKEDQDKKDKKGTGLRGLRSFQ